MSGCDKSLRHGRPVNAVAEDRGSEGVSTHSLTSDTSALAPSNTPAPTPEPSKSAPSSDTADTGSSVVKYVGWAFAFIALIVGCYDVFRYFKPKEIIVHAPNPVKSVNLTLDEFNEGGYKYCHSYFWEDRISYTWYLAKRKIKRNFWFSLFASEELDSKIPVYELVGLSVYFYKPAPNE